MGGSPPEPEVNFFVPAPLVSLCHPTGTQNQSGTKHIRRLRRGRRRRIPARRHRPVHCGQCREVRRWLRGASPRDRRNRGLRCPSIRPASEVDLHPRPARRLTAPLGPASRSVARGVLTDKAQGSNALRALIAEIGAEAVVPLTPTRKWPIPPASRLQGAQHHRLMLQQA